MSMGKEQGSQYRVQPGEVEAVTTIGAKAGGDTKKKEAKDYRQYISVDEQRSGC